MFFFSVYFFFMLMLNLMDATQISASPPYPPSMHLGLHVSKSGKISSSGYVLNCTIFLEFMIVI